MSKIGNNPVIIDQEVTVIFNDNEVSFKGPKGEMKLNLAKEIEIKIKDGQAFFSNKVVNKKTRALHGLTRMLFSNAVLGVKTPWEKTLEIQGVGFRVKQEGENLVFQVGFSHPVVFKLPPGVVSTVKGNKIVISGVNKQLVGEVAASIKRIRRPDKYKGKGIRYLGEVIKLKPGKKAKTAA